MAHHEPQTSPDHSHRHSCRLNTRVSHPDTFVLSLPGPLHKGHLQRSSVRFARSEMPQRHSPAPIRPKGPSQETRSQTMSMRTHAQFVLDRAEIRNGRDPKLSAMQRQRSITVSKANAPSPPITPSHHPTLPFPSCHQRPPSHIHSCVCPGLHLPSSPRNHFLRRTMRWVRINWYLRKCSLMTIGAWHRTGQRDRSDNCKPRHLAAHAEHRAAAHA